MASQFLRLRRVLTSISTITRPLTSPLQQTPSIPSDLLAASKLPSQTTPAPINAQSRAFTATRISLSSGKQRQYKLYQEGDEITEDTILFEGCDYNHWLITVDFPKDPKPTADEMVATYERICAQGLNISIEEAKKRMYACSTTTYQGFQAIMTEEESQRFESVPGVVFVLPDSYIDPVNKEYGGDKYENGVITPRPPPIVQQRPPRNRDRQPRYDRQGGGGNYGPPRQGGPQYGNQGPMQGGGGNYGPPQQGGPQYSNQGPMQGGGGNYGPPQHGGPQFRNQGPMQGGGGNYGPPQNYPPQQQNYGPPGQGDRMPMNNRGYAPGGTYDGNSRGPMPPYQGNYNQPQQGNPYPHDQRNFQGNPYPQGTNTGYGHGHPGEGPRFSPVEPNNMQGQPGNYNMGQTARDQGRS